MSGNKDKKCGECNKSSGFDGCSHIVCPKRKHITAGYAQVIRNGVDMNNGHRRTSKKYLLED